jgi:hypothetical protein
MTNPQNTGGLWAWLQDRLSRVVAIVATGGTIIMGCGGMCIPYVGGFLVAIVLAVLASICWRKFNNSTEHITTWKVLAITNVIFTAVYAVLGVWNLAFVAANI